MNVEVTNQPSLIVDAGRGQPTLSGVRACGLDADLMFSLGRYMEAGGLLQSILRVAVALQGEHRLATVSPTFSAVMRYWKMGFGSSLTFRSSGESHIEQGSTLDRSVVPNSKSC